MKSSVLSIALMLHRPCSPVCMTSSAQEHNTGSCHALMSYASRNAAQVALLLLL